ncbi:hypothetical protein GQ457_02G014010 [Hibiscus cannabinus]
MSIWSARGLIEKGYGWRIGSDQMVNIWNEPWLPGPGDGRVRNCHIDISYTYVSDLIDSANATWKVDVLEALFDEARVSRICSIPLSKAGLSDEIVWRPDGSGVYTVKSGYRLIWGDLSSSTGTNSSSHNMFMSRFYNEMWAVNLPSKIKINMWQITNNFLPTFENLQIRRLDVSNICLLCRASCESIEHLMRDCSFIKTLFDMQGVQLLSVSPDSVWNDSLVHKQVSPCRIGWSGPVEDVIKCNFDSAYDALSRESMSGFICRDNVRLIMASGVTFHRHVAYTFVALALACLQATIFAKDLGFAKVVIEGDSLTVIKKVCSSTPDGSLIGPIIHDIREASKGFESVIFGFVHRDANITAHTLAREGRGQRSSMFWIEEAPPGTTAAAARDWERLNCPQ